MEDARIRVSISHIQSQCSDTDFFILFSSHVGFEARILALEIKPEATVSVLGDPGTTNTEPEALYSRSCRVGGNLKTVTDDLRRQLPLLSPIFYTSVERLVRAEVEERRAFNIMFGEEIANLFVVLEVAAVFYLCQYLGSIYWLQNLLRAAIRPVQERVHRKNRLFGPRTRYSELFPPYS
jgi:hypothetical protein